MMTLREHSRLARELIDLCGGLTEAAGAAGVSKTLLSTYQNPNETATMSAKVMVDLQIYCGATPYSDAMSALIDAPKASACVQDAACEVTEAAGALQSKVRKALSDGKLTPREADEIAAVKRDVEHGLDQLNAALRAAEPKPADRTLKAV